MVARAITAGANRQQTGGRAAAPQTRFHIPNERHQRLCVTSELEKTKLPMIRPAMRRPSAVLPMVMSGVALAIVIGYATMFGVARQADEGTAAHLWQLLMIGQAPAIAFFVIKWFPSEPRQTLLVLALQIGAALVAVAPVWWLQW
jgi:hypothetical protein